MFRLIQSTPAGGDCTCGYKVELDKQYTVGSFIQTVLEEKKNEWGYIGIYKKGKIFGNSNCEYRHGNLTTTNIDDSFLEKNVIEIIASGGWSRMDYTIKCD